MLRSLRRVCKTLLILPALAALYLLIAALCAAITLPAREDGAPKAHIIYLAGNGVHMNLVLPVRNTIADWQVFLPDADLTDKSHVFIGWGSRTFYTQVPTWRDLRLSVALQALLLDETALHVQGVHHPPPANHPWVRAIALSDAQYRALSQDIQAQFAARRALADYPGFYPAKGRYTPFFTCNEWVRVRLSGIGLPAPLWSPFDRPLLWAFPQ